MADLDQLQVNITASTSQAISAIDKLIGAVSRLNSSLNNYTAGSQYAQGMENLATGLERVARAVNGIDSNKIKGISKAINSLANAGKNVSLGANMSKEMSKTEMQARSMAQRIAKEFNFADNKQGVSELTSAIEKVYNTTGDKSGWKSIREGVRDVIMEYSKFNNVLFDTSRTAEKVRQGLKGLKWSKADSAEYGDDLGHVLGKIGIRNLGGGTEAAKLAEELNGTLGTQFDTSSNVRAINDMLAVLERVEPEFVNLRTAIEQGTTNGDALQAFNRELYDIQRSASQAKTSVQDMGNVQVDTTSFDGIARSLESIKSVGDIPDFSGLNGLAKNLTKLSEADAGKLSESLPQIAEGLRGFEGLNIPNLSNLGEFAKGLKELRGMGAKSASEASDVLPRLSEGLRAFNGITIPDFGNIDTFVKGLVSLRSMGTNSANNASYVLPQIAEGLRAFSGISMPDLGNVEGLGKFAKAIGSLANVNIESAVKNFPRLAQAFNQLVTSINQGNIEKTTTSFASSMASLIRSVGGEHFQLAIDNLPRLAQAFNELVASINQGNIEERTVQFATAMAQLSRSCEQAGVRMKNVQQTTLNWNNLFEKMGAITRRVAQGALNVLKRALSGIGSQLSRAGQKVREFANSFFGMKKQAEDGATALNKFARAVGKFWASAFWIINGVRGLGKAIKSSMDYIETLNYFKAAFRQVSNTAVGDWAKLGYDSANAYADSFEKRAKQLTQKMTGFELSDTGILSLTGGKTLGLNPNTLLQYQAQFAQMASSMGASANNATLLSQALVEIGADLASVKNLKFEDVWQDMASGLVGMSRTLDKYGVNIRKAALEQKLLDLGIQATFEDLTGADKAMLRTIVLLDSTKYAWGDLANTINQPANQIRLLTANLQNCARMLGNIFLPLVAKVLPYLNAMAIAVQRLLTFIAQLLGVDLSKITSGVGGAGDAMSDLLDDADGLGDGLDDAADKAKKLKNNLLGVDELNVIGEQVTSADANGSMSSLLDDAFLDALSEYQKAWDDAFEKMENRANELADKIVKWFKDLFKPISDAWANVGDKVKDAWNKAFKSLGELLKTIFADVAEVWQSQLTTKIFENIFNIIKDIGLIISNLADNFRKAWTEGGRGKSILESIWQIIYAISENMRELADYAVEWAKNLDFAPLLESIKNLLGTIADNAYDIVGIFKDWYQIVVLGVGKYLIETFFPGILNSLDKMLKLIDFPKLRSDIDRIYQSLVGLAEIVGGWLLGAFDKLATFIGTYLNPVIERLADDFENLVNDLKGAQNINDVINGIFNFIDGRAFDVGSLVNALLKKLNEVLENLDFRNLGERIARAINIFLYSIDVNEFSDAIAGLVNGILDLLIAIIWNVDWRRVGEALGQALQKIEWSKVLEGIVKLGGGLSNVLQKMFEEAPIETTVIGGIVAMLAGNGILKALTGKGIGETIINSIFGLDGETSAFGRLKKAATGAGDAKSGFNLANKGLLKGANKGAKALTKEATAMGEVATAGETAGASLGQIALGIAGAIAAAGVGEDLIGNNLSKALGKLEGDTGEESWYHYHDMEKGDPWYQKAKGDLKEFADLWKGSWDLLSGKTRTNSEDIQKQIDSVTETYKRMVDTYGKTEADKKFEDAFGMSFTQKIEEIQNQKAGWREIGANIVGGILEGAVAFLKTLTLPFKLIYDLIVGGFKKIFGIASPAKAMYPIGEYIILGIIEGFKFAFSAFYTAITELFGNIVQWFTGKLGELKQAISDAWQGVQDTLIEKWQGIQDGLSALGEKFTEWKDNAVVVFNEWKDNAVNAARNVLDSLISWKDGVIENFGLAKQAIIDVKDRVVEFAQTAIENIQTFVTTTASNITTWVGQVRTTIETWAGNVVQTLRTWYTDAKNAIADWFTTTVSDFELWRDNCLRVVRDWGEKLGSSIFTLLETAKQTIDTWKGEAIRLFEEFKNGVRTHVEEFVSNFKSSMGEFIENARTHLGEFAQRAKEAFLTFFNEGKAKVVQFLEDTKLKFATWKENVLQTITNLKTGANKLFEMFVNEAKEWFSEKKWAFDGIRDGLANAFLKAWEVAKELWDQLKSWLENLDISNAVGNAVNKAGNAVKNVANGVKNVYENAKEAVSGGAKAASGNAWNSAKAASDSLSDIMKRTEKNAQDLWDMLKNGRKFATGGFPEDGLFFANHNELVGGFNGRTAVANNDQITDGIRQAVYDAFTSANGNSREEQLLEELIEAVRSGRTISIDGRELVNAYDNRKARNGYAF